MPRKNLEERRAYGRDYRKKNHAKKLAIDAAYREGHRLELRAYTKGWRERNPERKKLSARRNELRQKGLTGGPWGDPILQWEAIFDGQRRLCAVCGEPDPKSKGGVWHTDHDHATGVFRGIVCFPCNVMLGTARDTPSYLEEGAKYLRSRGKL